MSATFSSSGKKRVPGQTVTLTCARHPERDHTDIDKNWVCTACSWVQLAVHSGLYPNHEGRLGMAVVR